MIVTLVVLGVAVLALIIGMAVGSSLASERNLGRSIRQADRQREINAHSAQLADQAVELNQLIKEARRVLYPRRPPQR
jgi:uncharacterized membrane-anchored protein YhcB (DUF1043 family)